MDEIEFELAVDELLSEGAFHPYHCTCDECEDISNYIEERRDYGLN